MKRYFAKRVNAYYVGSSAFALLSVQASLTQSSWAASIIFALGAIFLFLYAHGLQRRPVVSVANDEIVVRASYFGTTVYRVSDGYSAGEIDGKLQVTNGDKVVSTHRLDGLLVMKAAVEELGSTTHS